MMKHLIDLHIEYLDMQNYSPRTCDHRRKALMRLMTWLETRGIERFNDVSKPILERYRRFLYHRLDKHGRPMSAYSQHAQLVPVRQFFKWLTRQNYILYNPASELELPKKPQRLPKHTLSAAEADMIINLPDVDDPVGLRDRAILEVLYSTGIRRMELINLGRYDINESNGVLSVRQGKGRKDRFVPIGERALLWVTKYRHDARPLHVLEPDPQTLFLDTDGTALDKDKLTRLVRRYVKQAGINKSGSCHLFRHTVATLMLENGADIRFIQQLLGHAHLSTTEVYTQVAIHKLKQIHTLTHPARLEKRRADHDDHSDIADDPEPDTDDLLDALEAGEEAGEDDA